MTNTSTSLYFGTSEVNSTFRLIGQMDEIAVFNIELSASQVTDLYNGGLAGTPIIG